VGPGGAGQGGEGRALLSRRRRRACVCDAAPAGRDTAPGTGPGPLGSSSHAHTPGIRARPGVSRRKSIAVEVPDRAQQAILSADAGFGQGKPAGTHIR
jgi:hypothetical protein